MESSEYDRIVDSVMLFLPLFRGVFLKICENDKKLDIRNSHYTILGLLKRRGPLPMSEISLLLAISKPNMTVLVDKLIKGKEARRIDDENDRRVVRIEITEKGRETLRKAKERVKKEFKKKLSKLDNKEIELLSKSLENIKNIISKIN